MPNIKPISDSKNYNEVLRDVTAGEPVSLTKNGRGRYILLDINDYKKTQAIIKLMTSSQTAKKPDMKKAGCQLRRSNHLWRRKWIEAPNIT